MPVAVAQVRYEGLSGTETYWLHPVADGHAVHELWFSFSEGPDRIACCGRLETEEALSAEDAAEILLESLWYRRYVPAVLLSGFTEGGLLGRPLLDRIYADYVRRNTPLEVPDGSQVVHGELFYADGSLRYRGEISAGLPHGQGVGFWKNGTVWCEGEFRDGWPHGNCVLHREGGGLLYEGQLIRGTPGGQGREYRKDGLLWFEGTFGEKPSVYHAYGGRHWVRGRLWDEQGNVAHDGEFQFDGKHSRPVKPKRRDDPAA